MAHMRLATEGFNGSTEAQSTDVFSGIRASRGTQNFMATYVTPSMAKRFLENVGPNRTIKKANLKKIAQDLKCGRWKYDGAPIRFDEQGKLLDGQHRLTAIIETGIAAECLLVKNIPTASMEVIDSGRSRSEAESLFIVGEKNTSTLAAATKLYLAYTRAQKEGLNIGFSVRSMRAISRAAVASFLNATPDFRIAVEQGQRFQKIASTAAMTTVYFLLAIEPADAERRARVDAFFEALLTGANLAEDSPILVLRNKFASMRAGTVCNNKMIGPAALCFTIRAWNAEQTGVPMTRLRTPDTTDLFPKVTA